MLDSPAHEKSQHIYSRRDHSYCSLPVQYRRKIWRGRTSRAKIAAPVNEEVVLIVHASGSQIYVCQAGSDEKLSWTLKAPDAELADAKGKNIGHHSAGPSWKLPMAAKSPRKRQPAKRAGYRRRSLAIAQRLPVTPAPVRSRKSPRFSAFTRKAGSRRRAGATTDTMARRRRVPTPPNIISMRPAH